MSYFVHVVRMQRERYSSVMDIRQDQEQEEDQGRSGLMTFVMVVLTWV